MNSDFENKVLNKLDSLENRLDKLDLKLMG